MQRLLTRPWPRDRSTGEVVAGQRAGELVVADASKWRAAARWRALRSRLASVL
jgi:hypothetical protein